MTALAVQIIAGQLEAPDLTCHAIPGLDLVAAITYMAEPEIHRVLAGLPAYALPEEIGQEAMIRIFESNARIPGQALADELGALEHWLRTDYL